MVKSRWFQIHDNNKKAHSLTYDSESGIALMQSYSFYSYFNKKRMGEYIEQLKKIHKEMEDV